MTLQEIIDRAVSIATRGTDPSVSPALAAEMVTEDLLVQIFLHVGRRYAADESRRHLLQTTTTVSVANGSVAVSQSILVQCAHESTLYDPVDATALYSYVPNRRDFENTYDQRIGYYCFEGSTLMVIQPTNSYVPGAGPTVDLELTIPTMPVVPAAATDQVAVRDEVIIEIVDELAEALRGK